MAEINFVDCNDDPLVLGSRVIYGAPPTPDDVPAYSAVIVELGEPDYDYDDELGRAREYAPKLKLRFANDETVHVGTYNVTRVSWSDYPDGPAERIYQAEDLELIKAAEVAR